MQRMENLLQGRVPFERVAAIDGLDMAQPMGGLSRFELACLASHRKAWMIFLESGADAACFMEDDVHISPEFAGFLADSDWIPGQVHAVQLETMFEKICLARASAPAKGRKLARIYSEHQGCAGYILTVRGARRFLELTNNPVLPLDYLVFPKFPQQFGLDLYQVMPALVAQDSALAHQNGVVPDIASSIQKLEKRHYTIGQIIWREFDRAGLRVGNWIKSVRYRKPHLCAFADVEFR